MKIYLLIILGFVLAHQTFAQKRQSELGRIISSKKKALLSSSEILHDILIPKKKFKKSGEHIYDSAMFYEFNLSMSKQINLFSSELIRLKIPYQQKALSYLDLELFRVDNLFYDEHSSKTKSNSSAQHYRGIIKGYENTSLVAISICADQIAGLISIENIGNFVLGKMSNSDLHVIYNAEEFSSKISWTCYKNKSEYPSAKLVNQSNNLKSNKAVNNIGVFFEVDYDTYVHFSQNETLVYEYVYCQFNQVAAIYQNEGLLLSISDTYIHKSPDNFTPWDLNEFAARRPNFNGDIAFLINYEPPNSGGGTANFEGLCVKPYAIGGLTYSFENYPIFSNNVNTITHEIGHILGSQHTQDCVWNNNCTAIDGCWPDRFTYDYCDNIVSCATAAIPGINQGTIMSYCHLIPFTVGINFSLGFGLQPGNRIRNFVGNSCLVSCVSDINHSGSIGSGEYSASNRIYSMAKINAGANVLYKAGRSIEMQPGFEANSYLGSVFSAKIENCASANILTSHHESEIDIASNMDFENQNVVEDLLTDISIKNYPNPFSSETTFSFSIIQSGKIELIISSGDGMKISTLIDNKYYAKGTHLYKYSVSNLDNGIYYVTLKSGTSIKTKKIVLMK